MVRLPNNKVNITWEQLKAATGMSETFYIELSECERYHDLNESYKKTREPYTKPECRTISFRKELHETGNGSGNDHCF
jgi:hypothetical protein